MGEPLLETQTPARRWDRGVAMGGRAVALTFWCFATLSQVHAEYLTCTASAQLGSQQSQSAVDTQCATSDQANSTIQKTVIAETENGPEAFLFTTTVSSSTQVTVTPGHIQGVLSASASSGPAYYDVTDDDGGTTRINDQYDVGIGPTSIGVWGDQFTVGGVPTDSIVQFRVTIVPSGAGATSTECVSDYNYGSTDLVLYVGGEPFSEQTQNGSSGLEVAQESCNDIGFDVATGIVTFVYSSANSFFGISAVLTLGGQAFSGPFDATVIPYVPPSSVNAGGAYSIYIDPITPGLFYVDAAGVKNGFLTPSSTVPVPNLVGNTLQAATTALIAVNLKLGSVTSTPSATVPTGEVISESPAAGVSAAEGSAVNLVLSSGPRVVTVPNLVGLSQAAAATALSGSNLVLGTVSDQTSPNVPAGDVLSQSPAAGTSANAESPVNIVVSSGAPQIAISLAGAPQVSTTASGTTLTIPLQNNGNTTLTTLEETSATLNGFAPVAATTSGLTQLAPASVGKLVLVFPADAGSGTVPLKMSGSYTAGTFAGSWTIGARVAL